MKIKPFILTLAVLTAITFSACDSSKQNSQTSENTSSIAISEPKEGTFDIEYVRKQINIKGQAFEIPMALKDLPEGWTWKEHENTKYCDEGHGLAYIYYNDKEMFVVGLENYYKKAEGDGIVYNLTIETEDCSIDGLLPIKSTKQDVVDKYGDPIKISKYGSYYYGIVNNSDTLGGIIKDQSICVKINDDDTIKSISITYADLSKEKY
ncbi:MAG: hypothetical protein LKG21_07885 [Ruminococcus sp.]|jgi:hypothetical protein|nr:hypothetical protein [Ruminococcus sp.]